MKFSVGDGNARVAVSGSGETQERGGQTCSQSPRDQRLFLQSMVGCGEETAGNECDRKEESLRDNVSKVPVCHKL